MKVFLIGFMGAGKSTIGKRLANKLECQFIDSDHAIEKEAGMTVEEIFQESGEDEFRAIESKWLRKLDVENAVIALGGGTPCHGSNMEFIKEKGISVYIILSAKALSIRLASSKTVRPLIESFKNDSAELTKFIEEKLEEREVFYNQANIKIDGINLDASSIDRLVDLISMSN
jgi:shikimate kinase